MTIYQLQIREHLGHQYCSLAICHWAADSLRPTVAKVGLLTSAATKNDFLNPALQLSGRAIFCSTKALNYVY